MRCGSGVEAPAEVRPHQIRVRLGERHLDPDLARVGGDVRDADARPLVRRVGLQAATQVLGAPVGVRHLRAASVLPGKIHREPSHHR